MADFMCRLEQIVTDVLDRDDETVCWTYWNKTDSTSSGYKGNKAESKDFLEYHKVDGNSCMHTYMYIRNSEKVALEMFGCLRPN